MTDLGIASSVRGTPIRLTAERWQHIVGRHPELEGRASEALAVVERPDQVQRGDFGTLLAVRMVDQLYLAVIYRETSPSDGFVVTAYLTRRLRKREVVWKS